MNSKIISISLFYRETRLIFDALKKDKESLQVPKSTNCRKLSRQNTQRMKSVSAIFIKTEDRFRSYVKRPSTVGEVKFHQQESETAVSAVKSDVVESDREMEVTVVVADVHRDASPESQKSSRIIIDDIQISSPTAVSKDFSPTSDDETSIEGLCSADLIEDLKFFE